MDRRRMDELIDQHVHAEDAGDLDTAVAVYTDDIEHDVVGAPGGPLYGPAAARERYATLLLEVHTDEMHRLRTYYADDACIVEHLCTATVNGQLGGLPGLGRQVSFRILHVFEFRDDRISRENVWMDTATVAAQLAPQANVPAAPPAP